MANLPTPGGDQGTWGTILNDFLKVSHNNDGTLQSSAINTAGGQASSDKGQPNGYAALSGSGLVPLTQLGSGTASNSNFLRGDGIWAVPNGTGGSSSLSGDTDVLISSPSNDQVLTYNTSSGKWVNQTLPSAPVSTVFGRAGAVVAQSGDYTAAQVTNAADKSSASVQTFTGNISTPAYVASGLTGATAASRYVGATASGAPASGTFVVGDFAIDQTGLLWICTTAGTPGTWTKGSISLDATASDIQPLGVQAAGSTGKAADASHVHAMPRLDQVASPTAAVSLNSQKITSLANGSAATDAAAFGQIPTSLAPSGTAGGDLGSTYPNPTVVSTHLAAALPVLQGGTGQTSTSSAFNALSPNTTLGDITYANGSGTNTRLGGNTSTTKKILTQTGDGTNSVAPAWGTIQAADVPTLNQNTTGNAATVTTNANLTGDVTSVGNATTLVSTANVKTVIETVRLDQMAAPTTSVSLNSQKITSLANGSAATDAAAFGQVPTASSAAPLVNSTIAASAGSSTSFSRGDHVHPRYDWVSADYGFISWAFDPAVANVASTPLATAGTFYVVRLHVPVATSATNILTSVVTAGVALTSGQCFAALYQGGNLLGTTADQSGSWISSGNKTMAISGGPVAVVAGDVFVGFWFNGTTGPAFVRGTSLAFINFGLTLTSLRFGTANTGLTTTAPGTLGTISAFSTVYWVALS